MELEKFKDANRNELSMIEVAHAILNEHGKEMVFADLVNEIQTFLGKSDQEIRERLPQFYMDHGMTPENAYQYYWQLDYHNNSRGYQLYADGVFESLKSIFGSLNK